MFFFFKKVLIIYYRRMDIVNFFLVSSLFFQSCFSFWSSVRAFAKWLGLVLIIVTFVCGDNMFKCQLKRLVDSRHYPLDRGFLLCERSSVRRDWLPVDVEPFDLEFLIRKKKHVLIDHFEGFFHLVDFNGVLWRFWNKCEF